MTPDEIVPPNFDENIERLLRKLGLAGPPGFVGVHPDAWAIRGDCFGNVDKKLAASGGTKVYGWNLRLFPDVWVAGEFHAIWQDPGGDLVDVTPTNLGSKILFVADPTRTFNGRTFNNEHFLISKKPLVAEYVDLVGLRTNFVENRRVGGGLNVAFQGNDAQLVSEVTAAEGYLLQLVRDGASRNDDCPCGSGTKFKHCHEPSLAKLKVGLRHG